MIADKKLLSEAIKSWEERNPSGALKLLNENALGSIGSGEADRLLSLYWISLCIQKWGDEDQKNNLLYKIDDVNIWPISEIYGHHRYSIGEIDLAYEKFSKNYFGAVPPEAVPTWSMGISAYYSFSSRQRRPKLRLFVGKAPTSSRNVISVGADEKYLSFCQVLARSLKSHKDCILAIALYSTSPDEKIFAMLSPVIEEIGIGRILVYVVNENISMLSERNSKGYFTFLRYFLALELCKKMEFQKMVVPDVDLVVQSGDFLDDLGQFSNDIGLLMVGRWPRPWLRFTAPMVVVAGPAVGQKFLGVVCDVAARSIFRTQQNSKNFLWGVDQAALQIAFDQLQMLDFENIIPFFRRNFLLAQDFGDKMKIFSYGS